MRSGQPHLDSNERAGLSLIELIVVIAVIAILVSLLLPAAQSAREVARRLECQSHLKQMMLACHNYQSAHRVFPPGGLGGFSLHAAILPFVDQGPLYEKINFGLDVWDDPNVVARETNTPLFRCPSDSQFGIVQGQTNYQGNSGIGVQCGGYRGPFCPVADPPIYHGTVISPTDISDGLSNTAGLSEALVGAGMHSDLRSIWQVSEEFGGCDQLDEFSEACESLDLSGQPADDYSRGLPWLQGDNSITLYNHISGPNRRNCTNNSWVPGGIWTATSDHPGIVNVVYLDGAVKSINESINLATWRAIGTRDGAERIAD